MVEEDRVDDLARRRRQAERDVGDSQQGPAAGKAAGHHPQPFDRLDGAADEVLVPGTDGEDQRIEDQVAVLEAVFGHQQLAAAFDDFELAFAGDGHRPVVVVVDRPDDDGGAEAAKQGADPFEPGLPVFQIDRVDDRPALAVGQGGLDDVGVHRVDHQRNADRSDQALEEGGDVGLLVPVGPLEADVDDLGAVGDLAAGDLGGLVPAFFIDQPPELPRPDDVGPLADEQGPGLGGRLDEVDPGEEHTVFRGAARSAGRLALDHGGDRRDMPIGRAAAPSDDVEPPGVDEAFEGYGEHLGGLEIAPVLVGHSGVGVTDQRTPGQPVEGAQVIGHRLGPGRTVEAQAQKTGVLQGDGEGRGGLTRQHRTRGLDRARGDDRPGRAGFPADVRDGDQGGLGRPGVLAGLDEEEVDAPFEQTPRLDGEALEQFVEGHAPCDRDRPGRRPDRTGDEPGSGGRRGGPGGFDGQFGGPAVEFVSAVGQVVLRQHDRRSAEGVGLDDVGARFEVGAMDAEDDVGPGLDQDLVAALPAGPAEVLGTETGGLEHRAGRAVEHEDPLVHQGPEFGRPVVIPVHGASPSSASSIRPMTASGRLNGAMT